MLRCFNDKHEQTHKWFWGGVSEDELYVIHVFILHIHYNRQRGNICVCVCVCSQVKTPTGFVALIEFPLQLLDLAVLESKIISTSTSARFKRVTCVAGYPKAV